MCKVLESFWSKIIDIICTIPKVSLYQPFPKIRLRTGYHRKGWEVLSEEKYIGLYIKSKPLYCKSSLYSETYFKLYIFWWYKHSSLRHLFWHTIESLKCLWVCTLVSIIFWTWWFHTYLSEDCFCQLSITDSCFPMFLEMLYWAIMCDQTLPVAILGRKKSSRRAFVWFTRYLAY